MVEAWPPRAAAPTMRGLVGESLAVLRWEVPPLLDRLGQQLAGLATHFEVAAAEGPTETFGLAADAHGVRVVAAPEAPAVVVRTDRATIAALLQGHLDLRGAVLTDRLYLLGSLQDVRRLLASLDTWLHGAVRADGCTPLLDRFLGSFLESSLGSGR